MAFNSFPLSYKSLQENISSMYKNMHTFSFRKIQDENPEQRRANQQTENLKWQQDMFHRILNKIGLHNEGIISEEEVSTTRSDLLYALIASPAEGEWPAITRDKLLFLQELFYANCISEEDYHFSKRPLLLRLAVQGPEIDSRDVLLNSNLIPCTLNNTITEPDSLHVLPESLNKEETEWSVVEFKEDQSKFRNFPARSTGDCNGKYSMKQEINAMPCLGLTPYKGTESKIKHPSIIVPKSLDLRTASVNDCCPVRNPPSLPIQNDYKGMAIYINPIESFKKNSFWPVAGSIDTSLQPLKKESVKSSLLENTMASWTGHKRGTTRAKVKKAFNQLLLKVHKDHSKENQTEATYSFHTSDSDSDTDEQQLKSGNKSWGLDLFKSSKKNKNEADMDHLPLNVERSEESLSPSKLVLRPIGQGPNTKKIKRKIHSDGAATDFFVDKVLGENIKMELSRILAEMGTTNPNPKLTLNAMQAGDEQIESIATRLPVDKNELTKFFPTSWCERYGDVVLDVVRKEFKHHVREMENLRRTAQERRSKAAKRWGLKDHDMNCSPKTDKNKVVHSGLNRYYASQDENSDQNNSHHRATTKVTFSLPSSKAQLTCSQTLHEYKLHVLPS